MNPLASYINNHCHVHPAAIVQLNAFVGAFRAQLEPDLRPAYTHARIVGELVEQGFAVGKIKNTYHVGGLSIGTWTVVGGELELQSTAA